MDCFHPLNRIIVPHSGLITNCILIAGCFMTKGLKISTSSAKYNYSFMYIKHFLSLVLEGYQGQNSVFQYFVAKYEDPVSSSHVSQTRAQIFSFSHLLSYVEIQWAYSKQGFHWRRLSQNSWRNSTRSGLESYIIRYRYPS